MKNISDLLVHQFLERSAENMPDKEAIICDKRRLTYREINSMSDLLAGWLINKGVQKGDRIPMILVNGPEYVISYYGIMKAGAVSVPLSTDLDTEGLSPLVDELEPPVIICSTRFEKLLNETDLSGSKTVSLLTGGPEPDCKGYPYGVHSWDDVMSDNSKYDFSVNISQDDIASIIYTSGSTGKAKGVMLTHRNIAKNVNSICQYLKITEEDRQMVVLPFFYVMGKSLLNTHFAVGGTVVINNSFAYPASVIKQMVEEKVTGFSGVPSTFAYLLHRSPLENYRESLGSLRYCSQAGGHMSRQIKEKLRKVLPPHTDIVIMYGATEASARLTWLDPKLFEAKIDSIGKAIPDVTMKILNDKGREVNPMETGELVGAGENIMQGYWKDKAATAAVLDHNGYHTGDLGYMDEEGFLYLIGRKDNLLKVGGHRINPQDVEDRIMETGQVIEVAVVGVPDELLGNRLIAVAVPVDKDFDELLVIEACMQKLPRYKQPSEFRFIRSLPKKVNGKIDKAGCRNFVLESDAN